MKSGFIQFQMRLLALLLYPFVWWQIRKIPNWKNYSKAWKRERIKKILRTDEVQAELQRRKEMKGQ